MDPDQILLLNLSGRGDKDVEAIEAYLRQSKGN
jgi:tryptophan synthase beta subunit